MRLVTLSEALVLCPCFLLVFFHSLLFFLRTLHGRRPTKPLSLTCLLPYTVPHTVLRAILVTRGDAPRSPGAQEWMQAWCLDAQVLFTASHQQPGPNPAHPTKTTSNASQFLAFPDPSYPESALLVFSRHFICTSLVKFLLF